jgi:hypothetical protein
MIKWSQVEAEDQILETVKSCTGQTIVLFAMLLTHPENRRSKRRNFQGNFSIFLYVWFLLDI